MPFTSRAARKQLILLVVCCLSINLLKIRAFAETQYGTVSLCPHHTNYNPELGTTAQGITCIDSDVTPSYPSGINPFLQGSVSQVHNSLWCRIYTDSCVNQNTLNEYYCLQNNLVNKEINCLAGCNSGQCNQGNQEYNLSLSITTENNSYQTGEDVNLIGFDHTQTILEKPQEKQEQVNELENNLLASETKSPQEKAIKERIEHIRQHGTNASKTGRIEILYYDDFKNRRTEIHYLLKDKSGRRYRIYFLQEVDLSPQTEIKVDGIFLESDTESEGVVISYVPLPKDKVDGPQEISPLGEQKTAVLLINFQDNPIQPMTVEEAARVTFDYANDPSIDSVTDWIKEVSFGKAWLTGDVFGWYTIPYSEGSICTNLQLLMNTVIPLADNDIYFPNYERLMMVVPANACLELGVAIIESTTITTADGESPVTYLLLNGVERINDGVGTHELGHNFGLRHAQALDCGNNVIGGECTTIAYGDLFDDMGWYLGKGHYNSIHKEQIGWIAPSNVLETSKAGTYLIHPLETENSGTMAVKIPIPEGFSYYVDYRRPIGYDHLNYETYGENVYDGVMLHIDHIIKGLGDPRELAIGTHILDTSPQTGFSDVALRPGESFLDPYTNIAISTRQITEDNAEIELFYPFCGNGITEPGEECDGEDLGTESCQSMDYESGILGCTAQCEFDVSQCEEPLCGPGHTYLGDGVCRAVIDVDEADGALEASTTSTSTDNWNELRHSSSAWYVNDNLNFYQLINLYTPNEIPGSNQATINRVSLPFDTSSIPGGATILSGDLSIEGVFPILVTNSHPESTDFIVLVPTTLANPPYIMLEDFDQFGSVDNPTELSARFDISNELMSDGIINFGLTQDGLGYINKSGFTVYGLRGGYDLVPNTPNNGETTFFRFPMNSATNSFGGPKLIIKYVRGPNSKIQNHESFEVTGRLTLKVQKKVNNEWQNINDGLIFEGEVTVPANGSRSLAEIWNPIGWTPIESGEYRAFAAFRLLSQRWTDYYEFLVSK